MRLFGARKVGAISATIAAFTTAFVAAGASAATMVIEAVQSNFGTSFPDPTTWALMLASFGIIGAGVRARKRSVVIS